MIFERKYSVMDPLPSNVVPRSQRYAWWFLAFLLVLPLVVFQRFSAINYPVISEEELVKSLVPAYTRESLQKGDHFCQTDLKKLKKLKVDLPDVRGYVAQSPLLKAVSAGGVWQPKSCAAKFQVVIIVPYRDREDHLRQFLSIIHPFLQAQLLDYKIIVVEQTNKKPFNRAMLFNVGFLESKAIYGHISCLIFHDVDLIPLDGRNIYACTEDPRHMSSSLDQFRYNLPYPQLFGGAVAMTTEIFEEVNGFSNLFFGWGGEDDDFRQNRLASRDIIRFEPHIARYTTLRHLKANPSADRMKILMKNLEEKNRDIFDESDGLTGVNYTMISKHKKPLFTHVVVDL